MIQVIRALCINLTDTVDSKNRSVNLVRGFHVPGIFRFVTLPAALGSVLVLCCAHVKVAQSADAFPERFLLRLSSYSVHDADVDITVLSSTRIGTGVSFVDDLGGDDSATIPRLDGYYRFNTRHRVDFSTFKIDRDGRNLLTIDVDLGEESYSVGDTVVSDIAYELFKLGYGYSFYHSEVVELSFTFGLSFTTYDFDYERADGSSADSSKASGPLPMWGMRMGYAIGDRWSVHYLSETFFIEAGDEYEGAFLNSELSVQYRFPRGLVIGAGVTRFSIDLTADDEEWRGRIADNHRGLLVFGSYYFR